MNIIRSEWPLIIFTTLAPLCAGAWVVAAALVFSEAHPQASALTTWPYGAVLCGLMILSIGLSTVHLGKPLGALRAFMRLGNSTVSNEVFTGALFASLAILYLVFSQSFAAGSEVWGILLALAAASAIMFVLFQCLAYRMRTVPTWNSIAFSVEGAFTALSSGVCVEGVLALMAFSAPFGVRLALVVVGVLGCIGMVIVVLMQGLVVSKAVALKRDREHLLTQWSELAALRVAALLAGTILWGWGMLSGWQMIVLAAAGAVLVIAGIAIGRYSFYSFGIGAGLPQPK